MQLSRSSSQQSWPDLPNLNEVTVPTDSVARLRPDELQSIVTAVEQRGFAILEPVNPVMRQDLLDIGAFFGTPAPHDRADAQGVTAIAAEDSESDYLGAKRDAHHLHVDGAMNDIQEDLMVVQSIKAVPVEKGGLTILADGAHAVAELASYSRSLVSLLENSNAITVTRNKARSTKPVLAQMRNGNLRLCFRSDAAGQGAQTEIDPGVAFAFQRLSNILFDIHCQVRFRLRPGCILITDNARVVHGRTAFQGDRMLLRRNVMNNGLVKLSLGIRVPEA